MDQMDKSDEQPHPADRKERYKAAFDQISTLYNKIGNQLTLDTCLAVHKVIQTCDDIHKEVPVQDKLENTSEVVLDAQIMKHTHESMTKLLQCNSEFSVSMYQNAINASLSHNDSESWLEIAKIATSIPKCLAIKPSLFGAIDVEPETRVAKERQQRKRTQTAEEKQPETIEELKREEHGAKRVKIILKQISDIFRANGRTPIPFFKLIIDPNNFMSTVENAFHVSFLARDGNIAIETGDDGNPQVRLVSKDEMDMHQETSQSICKLTMELCEKMTNHYNIREAMLRVPTDTDGKNNEDDSESD